jgi:hypothetical protein
MGGTREKDGLAFCFARDLIWSSVEGLAGRLNPRPRESTPGIEREYNGLAPVPRCVRMLPTGEEQNGQT